MSVKPKFSSIALIIAILPFLSHGSFLGGKTLKKLTGFTILFAGIVYYLQEVQSVFNSAAHTAQRMNLDTLCLACSNATSYGVSFWMKKIFWYPTFNAILRLANDPTYSTRSRLALTKCSSNNEGEGRLILLCASDTVELDKLFYGASTDHSAGTWENWKQVIL